MSGEQDLLLSDQLLKILATLIAVLDDRTPLFKQILRHQEEILANQKAGLALMTRIEGQLSAKAPP